MPESSVFGILGPNGSGKTTLLGILLDVLKADGGHYQWMGGITPEEARKKIGSLLETPNFYHYLSATDNLDITAAIRGYGQNDKDRVLKATGLFERRDSAFQSYSLGMKQRLAIAATLLGKPTILVLEEPTNGLDPAGIAEIRNLIKQLRSMGITIIIASHLLDEIEKVCTHVAILKKGQLLLTRAVNEVLLSEDEIEVAATDLILLEKILLAMPGITQVRKADSHLRIAQANSMQPAAINDYCYANGITLTHLFVKKRSLESKFMELTHE